MALPTINLNNEAEAMKKNSSNSSMKGKPNSRAGSPRARITEGNALHLAFAAKFPCADLEAFSVLANREESFFGPGGELPSVRGTETKLRKLMKLQALERYRMPTTGEHLYGASQSGMGFAEMYDYDMHGSRRIEGISDSRANHFRMIAHGAAQLVSPAGFFKESLGLEPITMNQLVTEKAMIQARQPVRKYLDEQAKQGANSEFGRWRAGRLKQAIEQVKAGKFDWDELLDVHPALFSVGYPQQEGSILKDLHQPDLVILSERNGPRSENILIEVELSTKLRTEYDAILATLKKELDYPYVYGRAVYFTVGKDVEVLLRKSDQAGGYGLFDSGKLTVLPLLHRDGSPVIKNRRITLGA